MKNRLLLTTAVAAVLLSAAAAQAADYTFSGLTDSGPLAGQAFSGSFSFNDLALVSTGDVALTGFSLSFAGQSYSLGQAEAQTVPVASFADGSFIGLNYVALSTATLNGRPAVGFTSGFTSFGEAYFAYALPGAQGGEGYGSYAVTAVPEPQTLALMLAGLAAIGWRARRARRGE